MGYVGDNVFVGHESSMRITGDLCHLAGIVGLFLMLVFQQDATGISIYSQELFAVSLATRYLNPMQGIISAYRILVAGGYLIFTMFILLALRYLPNLKATYSEELDKCPYLVIGLGCALLAALTNIGAPLLEQVWWFSVYLEGLALLPQVYIMGRIHERGLSSGVIVCFYLLGGYPLFYFVNWMFFYHDHAFCQSLKAIAPGVAHLVLFAMGLLHAQSAHYNVRGAVGRLVKLREGYFGVGDDLFVRDVVTQTYTPIMRISEGIVACVRPCVAYFWQVAPDLEVPEENPGPKGPKHYPFFTRNKKEEDEGLMNLLPVKFNGR